MRRKRLVESVGALHDRVDHLGSRQAQHVGATPGGLLGLALPEERARYINVRKRRVDACKPVAEPPVEGESVQVRSEVLVSLRGGDVPSLGVLEMAVGR